ncbi:MAG: hypothetical protein HOY75_13130 [Streptomyces sp.]|nr:hypothetical protein [Streptomyces sp.]
MTELLTAPNGSGPLVAAGQPPAAKDFSRQRKRLDFTIDDDTFDAAPALPGDVFAEFVALYNSSTDVEGYQEQHTLLKQALELALLDESWARFSARLKDKQKPIEDDQMSEVVMWLLEEYGMRPTQPSQPSPDGPSSPESGTSSTESTQPEESTSAPSPQTAS